MAHTLMQRLRIVAQHVVSTLYNGLWSHSCSDHFTQLCTYASHEQQISSHPVIFETTPVYFYAMQLTHFLLKKRFAVLRSFFSLKPLVKRSLKASFTVPSVAATGILFVTACLA